jgi:hypothetical protein
MARISQTRVRTELAAGDNATTTTAKGDALEKATTYVFSKFPGIDLIDRKVRDHNGVREVDVFLRNEWSRSGLGFLHWFLVVECKNLAAAVGYPDVVVFKDLLRSKNCPSGVLVAASGIAGCPGQDAYAAIEDALQQQTTIVVVTRRDLEHVATTTELAHILEDRFTELTAFGSYRNIS